MLKRIILIGIAGIFLIGIIVNFSLESLCSREYSNKILSPDGIYSVQITESNCGGATGDIKTDVMITSEKSNGGFFNNKKDNLRDVFAFHGELVSVKASWLNNRTLKIAYSDCRNIYGYDDSWNDIKIVYEKQCSVVE